MSQKSLLWLIQNWSYRDTTKKMGQCLWPGVHGLFFSLTLVSLWFRSFFRLDNKSAIFSYPFCLLKQSKDHRPSPGKWRSTELINSSHIQYSAILKLFSLCQLYHRFGCCSRPLVCVFKCTDFTNIFILPARSELTKYLKHLVKPEHKSFHTVLIPTLANWLKYFATNHSLSPW